jgi:hemolysin activation/secretion protein
MPLKMKTLVRLKAVGLTLVMTQGACSFAQSLVSSSVEGPTLDIQRYVIEGDNPLSAEETGQLLAPFTGSKRTLRQIEEAANAMERAMRERGLAFHRMFVPAQKPSAGEVRLQIIGIKLGTVEVAGNEHFTSDNIRRSLTSLKEGGVPEVRTLGRDITASNANPAKQVTVTFKESPQASTVDAVVKVKDSPPMSFFLNLTGNQSLSGQGSEQNTYRMSGGFQHANLFDRDHVMTVSYTTDPGDPGKVSLYSAYYQIPLYGHGINLSASVTSSDVASGRVQQGAGVFDVSGSGLFTGIRLTKALTRVDTLQQTLGIGLEDRFFKNSTTFNGQPIQPDVGSRVVSLQYTFRNEPSWGSIAGSVDYAVNAGGGAGNTEVDHAANGGTRDWGAWRFNVEASVPSARWQYTGRLKGQYAEKSLISGEQFGLGGANSVRGFVDRVVSGDDGHQWSLEVMGPELGDLQIRPVLFVDGGQVHVFAGGLTENLLSAGVGLRMVYRKLQVGLDLAQTIERNSADLAGPAMRMHLALSYRF